MPTEFVIFMTTIVGLLSALIVMIAQMVALRRKLKGVENEVQAVHLTINSRMDRLLELTEKVSRAEGVKAGKSGANGE